MARMSTTQPMVDSASGKQFTKTGAVETMPKSFVSSDGHDRDMEVVPRPQSGVVCNINLDNGKPQAAPKNVKPLLHIFAKAATRAGIEHYLPHYARS